MTNLPLMSTVLVVSVVSCFFMNSWVSIWILLEMNTLAFCTIMKSYSLPQKTSTEMSMKYFVVQSISSALLIFTSISLKLNNKALFILLMMSTVSLMIKMAASPFQQWFVDVTKKSSWKSATVLMTWQKLAPVYLVIFQMKFYVLGFLSLSAVTGSLSQLNKKNVMEVMALSSVFNLSWMLMSVLLSTKILIIFSMIYWGSVVLMMKTIHLMKLESMNKESNPLCPKWTGLMVILNLAGIPPMAGFMAKWMVFTEGTSINMTYVITILLVTSSINLYIYMRVMNYSMMKNAMDKQKTKKTTSKSFQSFVLMMNVFPLAMVSL